MKYFTSSFILILLVSCNDSSKPSINPEKRLGIISDSNTQLLKAKYIKEYKNLEIELVLVEITQREKRNQLNPFLTKSDYSDSSDVNVPKVSEELSRVKLELQQLSVDSNNLYRKMEELLKHVSILEIHSYKSTLNNHIPKDTQIECNDMNSYNEGYSIANDQIGRGLMADCNYLYEIAKTQNGRLNYYCFCKGVNDWISKKK